MPVRDYLMAGRLESYDYGFDADMTPAADHFMTTHYLFENNKQKSDYFKEAKVSRDAYEDLVAVTKQDLFLDLQRAIEKAGFIFS